jgi:hypothetical protein
VLRNTASWRADLAWYLTISAAVGIAFGIGQGPIAGAVAGSGMLLYTAIIFVGRRHVDAIRVVGGEGDERTRALYTRATAAGGVTVWFVTLVWWLVGVARGEPNPTLPVLLLVFGLATIAASVYYARTS